MSESSAAETPTDETPSRVGRRRFLTGGVAGFLAGLVSRGGAAQARAPYLKLDTTDNITTEPTGLARQGADNVPGFLVFNQTGTSFASASPSGCAILGFSGGTSDGGTELVREAGLQELGGLFVTGQPDPSFVPLMGPAGLQSLVGQAGQSAIRSWHTGPGPAVESWSAAGPAILGFSGMDNAATTDTVRLLDEQEFGAVLLTGPVSADQITLGTPSALLAVAGQPDRTGIQVEHLGGEIALDVRRGKTRLATVGSGVIVMGHDTHGVVDQRVGPRSHVVVTLMSDPGEVFVRWIQRLAGQGFVLHLSGQVPQDTDFCYVVLEEQEPAPHPPPPQP